MQRTGSKPDTIVLDRQLHQDIARLKLVDRLFVERVRRVLQTRSLWASTAADEIAEELIKMPPDAPQAGRLGLAIGVFRDAARTYEAAKHVVDEILHRRDLVCLVDCLRAAPEIRRSEKADQRLRQLYANIFGSSR